MRFRRGKKSLGADAQANASLPAGQASERSADSLAELQQAHRRLQDLYEVSKLFASLENAEQPLDPALAIITRTLPLHGAILIEKDGTGSRMIVWPTEGQSPDQLRADKKHAEAAYAYLVGGTSSESVAKHEGVGMTRLPRLAQTDGVRAERFIVIPLVVANRPPFGVFQLEGAKQLDRADLMFVNAIANQLAIALDRDRAWRRDITRREHAEVGRAHAEAKGATAERDRVIAETSSAKYQALASENSRLYEQAQKAVSAREQILALVSHDLKNPLGTILMTSELLAQAAARAESQPRLAQGLERIQRSANSMLRLIDDLLDFASIEAGSLAIERRPQDPDSLIQETLARFESVACEKRVRLSGHIAAKLANVSCDRERILQVLSNLVSNAMHVTAEGGRIGVRVEARGAELLFAVSDDGPGISHADMEHVFERYWRGRITPYKGTGLGLAIASGVVRAHDGRIWVESELGRGTTFLFTLPASEAAGVRSAEAASV